jgi:hypothetical protein
MMKACGAWWLALLCSLAMVAVAHETDRLPVGDGRIATSPRVGYVDLCQTRFGGMGAFRDGPWLRGGYWYPGEKLQVQGNVAWPDARFAITQEGGNRVIRGNGLPDHGTGIFPIQSSDPVYQYDFNPNRITAQALELTLPLNPEAAATPVCVSMGMIGVTTSGVALFNAIDGQGRDAAAHEVQDRCDGHPEPRGLYHYHDLSRCLKDAAGKQGRHSELLGYALDGFGIFGLFGEGSTELHNSDLDACHGHTHLIVWDGKPRVMYHYHMTREYPYSVACFHGAPVLTPQSEGGGPGGGDRPRRGPPRGEFRGAPNGRRPPPPPEWGPPDDGRGPNGGPAWQSPPP